MRKFVYNSKGWVLAICTQCGRLNYVEPHGVTAQCRCSKNWTEHRSIPQKFRNMAGVYIGPARFDEKYAKLKLADTFDVRPQEAK